MFCFLSCWLVSCLPTTELITNKRSIFLLLLFRVVTSLNGVVVEVNVSHAFLIALLFGAFLVGTLALSLSHKLCLILLIRVGSDNLGTTLLLEDASLCLHNALNSCQSLGQLSLTLGTVVSEHFAFVVGRCNHLKLKLPSLIVHLVLGCQESLSDGLNTVIASEREGEVHSDLEWVHRKLTSQRVQKLCLVVFADCDLGED